MGDWQNSGNEIIMHNNLTRNLTDWKWNYLYYECLYFIKGSKSEIVNLIHFNHQSIWIDHHNIVYVLNKVTVKGLLKEEEKKIKCKQRAVVATNTRFKLLFSI